MTTYRPAVRAVYCALAALGLRAVVWVILATHRLGDTGLVMTPVVESVPYVALLAEAAVLVAAGYAGIAAHRREWNRTLGVAWLLITVAVVLPYVVR